MDEENVSGSAEPELFINQFLTEMEGVSGKGRETSTMTGKRGNHDLDKD